MKKVAQRLCNLQAWTNSKNYITIPLINKFSRVMYFIHAKSEFVKLNNFQGVVIMHANETIKV